ncbi:hypothetical protein F4778DRAFT_738734 [Xylariomycetidae sp. FL2044]|nr:hypothetical protein F4778DRAFT_738734 [Xylariomycetidae sp. FL2044]
MSGDNSGRSTNPPSSYADEIIRSILDDNASPRDISPSGELYRVIERWHSHRPPASSAQRELVRNHLRRWASRSPPGNSISSESNSAQHRRSSRDTQPSGSSPLYNLPPPVSSLPPLRSMNTRSARPSAMSSSGTSGDRQNRVRLSDRYSGRNRAEYEGRNGQNEDELRPWARGGRSVGVQSPRFGEIGLDRDGDHTRESHDPQLLALLDFTGHSANHYSELSFQSPPPQTQEPAEDNRRAKRRKLDLDRLSPDFQGFHYGKYGSVEPGQLKMELVSCDGGIYSDDGHRYAAENILKNDQTVYCTEGPRCNIVLRHQGATPFTLKELVIKAPRTNFTSPVQEGMVFVSMSSDHLLNRTAQYQIQYSPSSRSSRRIERETQPLTPIVSIRHNDDGSIMTRAQVRARRLYNIGIEDEDNELRSAQIPSEFNASPPPFRVTTECSDDEADVPYRRGDGDWRLPDRIGSLPFESESSDDDTNLESFPFRDVNNPSRPSRPSRRSRRSRASTALAEAAEAAQIATQEAVRAVGGELMVPHARFYIERNKSKCTIKFDPPVSGRFILLKMWNPHRDPDANIDIQAVVAKGFAGPRFFPSIDLQ